MKLDAWLVYFFLLFSFGCAANADEVRQIDAPYDAVAYTPRPSESGVDELDMVIREMIAATEARDWGRLTRHFSRKDNLITEMEQSWSVNEEKSLFWGAMYKALSLSGKFYDSDDGTRYYYTPDLGYEGDELERLYPQLDSPELDVAIVFDKDVAVKSRPDPHATTIEFISYTNIYYLDETDLIAKSANGLYYPWIAVLTPGGQKGFILGDKVFQFMNDYSASFIYEDGKWVLEYFLNG